jgi:hypothetical protein
MAALRSVAVALLSVNGEAGAELVACDHPAARGSVGSDMKSSFARHRASALIRCWH